MCVSQKLRRSATSSSSARESSHAASLKTLWLNTLNMLNLGHPAASDPRSSIHKPNENATSPCPFSAAGTSIEHLLDTARIEEAAQKCRGRWQRHACKTLRAKQLSFHCVHIPVG